MLIGKTFNEFRSFFTREEFTNLFIKMRQSEPWKLFLKQLYDNLTENYSVSIVRPPQGKNGEPIHNSSAVQGEGKCSKIENNEKCSLIVCHL